MQALYEDEDPLFTVICYAIDCSVMVKQILSDRVEMTDSASFQPQITGTPAPSVRQQQIDLSLFSVLAVHHRITIAQQVMSSVAGMHKQLKIQQLSLIQCPYELRFRRERMPPEPGRNIKMTQTRPYIHFRQRIICPAETPKYIRIPVNEHFLSDPGYRQENI